MTNTNFEKMNIQWFPGHMTKAQRMIEENIKLVDAVCEVVDSRIPSSSRNPDIDRLSGSKPRLIIMNRTDLADSSHTAEWKKYYISMGFQVIETDAKSGKGIANIVPAIRELLKDKIESNAAKGQTGKTLKIMILGIPNVGKSTIINKIAGRKAALSSDKPGVTRGKQWISIGNGIDLLDTPGILWPKFDSQEVGELLAITNAIKADVIDKETLGANFMLRLCRLYPEAVKERYKFDIDSSLNGFELLECAAKKRGFLISGGEYDIERMANTLLNEYHEGKLGRITLEIPNA